MDTIVDLGPGDRRRRLPPKASRAPFRSKVALRPATAADAPMLHALIASHVEEGRLLPRTLEDLTRYAKRFVVAIKRTRSGEDIVGCAELAPLSSSVAEVRSLVVCRAARGSGVGARIVEQLARRGRANGFRRLCAFAHDVRLFQRLGFATVPHTAVPEKIARDCESCALFRRCNQYALVRELRPNG